MCRHLVGLLPQNNPARRSCGYRGLVSRESHAEKVDAGDRPMPAPTFPKRQWAPLSGRFRLLGGVDIFVDQEGGRQREEDQPAEIVTDIFRIGDLDDDREDLE